jgi:hypothetical protein
MPSMRIASPERRWKAAAAPLAGGLIGWGLAAPFRLERRGGGAPGLPLTARVIVICLAAAVGLCLAALIMRTHLSVSDAGLADHRMFRIVRVPWQVITGFEVGRPGALRGGFCVKAVCRDGQRIDLMSTQAYSRVPSAWHLDELERLCWSLEEAARQQAGNP